MSQALKYKPMMPLLITLLLISSWVINFHVASPLNDMGLAQLEWLYLVDILIVVPVVCFWAIADKRTAAIKSAAYISLLLLIGTVIIPTEQQQLLPQLSPLRYLILALILAIEVISIVLVVLAVNTALKAKSDPDQALTSAVSKLTNNPSLSNILCLDLRMWSFLLCHKRIQPQHYRGQQQFSYHKKDGCRDNALGFIVIIGFELPIAHLLLHFFWSPLAANIITGLTLLSLLFFIAEYRALAKRPISIDNKQLIIRYGLYPSFSIDIDNISDIRPNQQFIPRHGTVKRFNLSGTPNLAITLKKPIGKINRVYLGVDNPTKLRQALTDNK
ncbi:hypothetical protein [Shewanella waksmanii]|uniref:hypothetical protein n=1 Tax=Shewanella waksmanii TaxID=213783 RepID=UPI003734DA26